MNCCGSSIKGRDRYHVAAREVQVRAPGRCAQLRAATLTHECDMCCRTIASSAGSSIHQMNLEHALYTRQGLLPFASPAACTLSMGLNGS